MRHRKKTVKLGRKTAHRNELLANLACALIDRKRITTTLPKAKAARSLAERMVTLGKKGTLADRRRAISILKKKDSVKELFDAIAPGFSGRSGGYTRIVKLGRRMSDGSEMAILEWVEFGEVVSAPALEPTPVPEPVEEEEAQPAEETSEPVAETEEEAAEEEEPTSE